jgi:hypothetical protein
VTTLLKRVCYDNAQRTTKSGPILYLPVRNEATSKGSSASDPKIQMISSSLIGGLEKSGGFVCKIPNKGMFSAAW